VKAGRGLRLNPLRSLVKRIRSPQPKKDRSASFIWLFAGLSTDSICAGGERPPVRGQQDEDAIDRYEMQAFDQGI
jgi:hypothetical protein